MRENISAMTGRSNPLIQPDNSKGGTEMDRMLTILAVSVAVIGALTAMAAVLTAAVRI